MSAFSLPAWVIKAIDKIRRDFLWGVSTGGSRKMHLISWDRMCLPKQVGGLGLTNLKLQNISLLLKWLWRLYEKPDSQWAVMVRTLYSKRNPLLPPIAWIVEGSFFWKDLRNLRLYFQLSSRCSLNNGQSLLFWYDKWHDERLSFFGTRSVKPTAPYISLASALSKWHSLFPSPFERSVYLLREQASTISLQQQNDTYSCTWTNDGRYSVSAMYRTLSLAGKTRFPLAFLWKAELSPTVKIFIFLLSNDKLLTQEQLFKRNLQVNIGCTLCASRSLETAFHLFVQCPFVASLMHTLTFHPGLRLTSNFKDTILDTFLLYKDSRLLFTIVAFTFYAIWLERNSRIFRNHIRPLRDIADWVTTETLNFLRIF